MTSTTSTETAVTTPAQSPTDHARAALKAAVAYLTPGETAAGRPSAGRAVCERFAYLREELEQIAEEFAPGTSRRRPRGYARWMRDHQGEQVYTAQLVLDEQGCLTGFWSPVDSRRVDARATQVYFDDSLRDYRGVVALHSTERSMLALDVNNGMVLVYFAA